MRNGSLERLSPGSPPTVERCMSASQSPAPAPAVCCANCGTELHGRFCGECGQHRNSSQRLRTREVLARGCAQILDLDAAFPTTFAGLWRHPGQLCRDYVAGRRSCRLHSSSPGCPGAPDTTWGRTICSRFTPWHSSCGWKWCCCCRCRTSFPSEYCIASITQIAHAPGSSSGIAGFAIRSSTADS